MKFAKAFAGFRPGTKVKDTWYGPGKVVKRTPRRLHIKLTSQSQVWVYDSEHVEHFIRKSK